ncbi:MerR family transcriptional regulator [Streptomyces armeniacus]|uniref:MerR family transcriptional regulator n=1 Tax=Streptomyces armeniacus TaxID=83291 RepID=A0A345XMV4_9ACTN|nr:MerR family transcriptional regulator [Streptomyces armeniacus]AXK32970.1 MerR family transcriptional regulator [Streptomyces armeniacus]
MSCQGAELRPVDLAREAGVSTQLVRNYEDAGILPPARRTPSGYRRLEDRHRRALLTYRALARGYGTAAARSIMRAVHDGDLPRALTHVNAAHAELHEQQRALRATGEALEAVAEQDVEQGVEQGVESAEPAQSPTGLRIGEVAAHLGVRTSALRVWESAGLLTPQRTPGTSYRLYGPADVRDARMIHMLRQSHYPLPQIGPVLDDLRQAGSGDALRAALARRQESLTARATAMLEGSGHLHQYVTAGA